MLLSRDDYEVRYEYWEAATEAAWVLRDQLDDTPRSQLRS